MDLGLAGICSEDMLWWSACSCGSRGSSEEMGSDGGFRDVWSGLVPIMVVYRTGMCLGHRSSVSRISFSQVLKLLFGLLASFRPAAQCTKAISIILMADVEETNECVES